MKNKSDFETGFSGMFWMGLTTAMNYCVQLIITYFIARLLSPSDYGQVAALTILIGLAELFWMLGVGQAIVQKKDLSEEDITTGNTLNILFGLVVFMIINIFATTLVKVFSISDVTMLRVYSIVFILNSFSGLSQSLSQKKCKFKRISIIRSFSTFIYGIAAITLAFLSLGAWSLIYANIIQTLFITILFIIFEPIPLRFAIKIVSVKKLLYFGGGFTIARFFNYLATRGDSFVVNKMMGKSELGILSRAQQLLMYPVSLVGETLDQVLFPLLSKSKDDYEKLRRVFLNGTSIVSLITAPISIVAFFRAEELIVFFLGSNWLETVWPFKMLIVGLFFRTGYKLSESLLRAMGKVYQGAIIQGIYACIVIVGAYIGHHYGLSGVALGVTVAFTINYIILTGVSMFLVKIHIKDIFIALIPASIYSSITVLIMIFANDFISNIINNFITCVVSTFIVFFVYGLVLITTQKFTMTRELRGFIFTIFAKVITFGRRGEATKNFV